MFYAAAILILLGVLIFIYSISIENPSVYRQPSPGRVPHPGVSPKTPDIHHFKEPRLRNTISRAPSTAAPRSVNQKESSPVFIDKAAPDSDNNGSIYARQAGPGSEQKKYPAEKISEPAAVMYEDGSNSIDYRGPSSEIDPSLEAYKKIRRIGEGAISSKQNGINFYIDKKLYRFDFHRIREFNTGSNYIAFRIADQPQVKLFIFKSGAYEAENIIKDYEKYTGEIG